MFKVNQLILLYTLILCCGSCDHENNVNSPEPFTTEIDSNLFQGASLNDISFLVPKEMSPVEDDDHHCEYSLLHREEHLIFTQTPCVQIFGKDQELTSYLEYFLDKSKKKNEAYKLQSIDTVIFDGNEAYVVCFKEKPWGFPKVTNNECFLFKKEDNFNLLHTWSVNDLDSSLIRKSKYTFVLD